MEFQSLPKMSLVSQYDDLCRYTKVLTCGSEEEFKTFVDGQLNVFYKWKETESKVEKMQEKMCSLTSDNKRLQTQIKALKDLVQQEMSARKKAELERNTLEKQICLVKEVLLSDSVMANMTKEKLGFLNSCKPSANSPTRLETIQETAGSLIFSDIDHTEDDISTSKYSSTHQCKGKRSSSESRISEKNKKLKSMDEELENNENETNNIIPHKFVTIRCNSEPSSTSPKISTISHPVHNLDSTQTKNLLNELRKCNTSSLSGGSPIGQHSTCGKLSRQHTFVEKVIYRPEKCNPCRHNVGFFVQALKCQDCAVICHPECKDKCPVPCIPVSRTPSENTTGTIADYTSSAGPMIPPLIVYCVKEIEERGLNEIGLYRVPGITREVKSLKDKFLNGHSIPHLGKQDINAICGTIKDFLRSLYEPLITHGAWQKLSHVADLTDVSQSLQAMHDILSTLPQPNRDTLAFLILHLQKVAESPECKMPVQSLAKIFGPTVFGYSGPKSAITCALTEIENQCKIMEQLLSLPTHFWRNLLNVEPDVFVGNSLKTPENTPAPKGTRLGPLIASSQKFKSVNFNRTPASGRHSRFNKSGKKFFSSPLSKVS